MTDPVTSLLGAAPQTDPVASLLGPGPAPSFWERLGTGMRDPIDAAAQMISHAVPSGVSETLDAWTKPLIDRGYLAPANPKSIDAEIAARNAAYEARRQAAGETGIDWTRAGGNLLTEVPLIAAGGAPTSLLKAGLTGARIGATASALTPETTQAEDFWKAKGEQALTGAETGAVLGPIGKIAGGLIQPALSKGTQYLTERGVVPTMGQLGGPIANWTEQKLSSLPLVGDLIKGARGRAIQQFNTAAYNEALKPIGETLEAAPGHAAVAETEKKLSDAYNSILPKTTFAADPQFSESLGQLHDLAQSMPPDSASKFTSIIQRKVLPRLGPGGTMDGQTFKGLDSELGKMASGYLRDPSFDARELGSAVRQTQSLLRQQLERSNPDLAPQLSAVNQGWAIYTRLRDAASRVGSDEGVFSPAQLQSAVRSGDKTVGHGGFAKGEALLQDLSGAGKSVLGNTVPNSGTFDRAALPFIMEKAMAGEIPWHVALAAVLGSMPYTSIGQKVTKALMADRPVVMQPLTGPLSSVVRRATPYLSPQLTGSILQGYPSNPLLGGQQ